MVRTPVGADVPDTGLAARPGRDDGAGCADLAGPARRSRWTLRVRTDRIGEASA